MGTNNNIYEIKINSIGTVKLKRVSFGDLAFIDNLLSQDISDKDFAIQALHYQFLKPRINIDDLKALNNSEIIKVAKHFLENEPSLFKYFRDTGDFFYDFRKAVQIHNEKYHQELKMALAPVIKTCNELVGSRDFQDKITQISSTAIQIGKSFSEMSSYIKPIIDKCNVIIETIKPQLDFFQKWLDQNKSIFYNIDKIYHDFSAQYQIAEYKAIAVLKKYKWFISPSMPPYFIFEVVQTGLKEGRQDKAINKLFINYFAQNNWHNLEIMTKDWESNLLFKKRSKIIKDCVDTLKNTNKRTNTSNVILPVLISQIDGFLTDYLDSKNIPYDCAYDDLIKKGKIKRRGRKTQFKKSITNNMPLDIGNLTTDCFLNILFQRSQPGKPLKTPFNFNRHKIMHGENVKYGRETYLIRSFLIIDFLVNLK